MEKRVSVEPQQVPLFDDVFREKPSRGIRTSDEVQSPAHRENRRDVWAGNVIGTVNEGSFVRRQNLTKAAGCLSEQTPKAVMVWFRIFWPGEDPDNKGLDHFLKVFLHAHRAGMLNEFLQKVQRGEICWSDERATA